MANRKSGRKTKKDSKVVKSKDTEQAKEIAIDEVIDNTQDLPQSRSYAWIAYIIFFVPYIISPNDEFVSLHTHNAIRLLVLDAISLFMVVMGIAFGQVVNLFFTIISLALIIGGVVMLSASLVAKVYLIYKSINGKYQEVPIFRNISK